MSNRVKEVRAAINRESSMDAIVCQLSELSDYQLQMVSDYTRGLKAAQTFLSK